MPFKMAEALQTACLYEGVIFHAYHAFEAICCAGLEELSDDMEYDRRLLVFIDQYPDGGSHHLLLWFCKEGKTCYVFRVTCFCYTQHAIRNTFLAIHVISKVLYGEHPIFHKEKNYYERTKS